MSWRLESMRGTPPNEVRVTIATCGEPGPELDALYKRRDELQAESLRTHTMTELRYGVNPE